MVSGLAGNGSRGPGPRGIVLTLAALVFVLAAGVWAVLAWADHARTLAEARSRSRDVARLLAEHTLRSVSAADLVIQQILARIAEKGLEEGRWPDDEWRKLRDLAGALHDSSSLWVLDAKGTVRATSVAPEPPAGDFSYRTFFSSLRDGSPDLHIGEIIKGRITGRHSFTVSRAIRHRDGHFAGVVVVGIEAEYYRSLFETLDLGHHGSIGVFHRNGSVLVREPFSDGVLGKSAVGGPVWTALAREPAGIVQGISPMDGTDRIAAYETVAGLPLVAVATIAGEDALAIWRRRQWDSAALGVVVVTVLLLFTGLALRSVEREAAAHRALIAANESLEERVRQRTEELHRANACLQNALDEARQARNEALRAGEAKARFFAAASHDLRQPWQALRLFLEVLVARLKDPQDREVAQKAMAALEGGSHLLTALLDVSTLQAGTVQAEPRPIALCHTLSQLADECEPLAREKGLAFHVVPSLLTVRSDPVLLLRILRNLINNAIRYTETGRVLIGCRRHGSAVRVEVWDSGIGIPADKLEVIFEDFYQIGNSDRDRRQGLGLGLSVVERMSRLLDHPFGVRSWPGRGSVFWVEVPMVIEEKTTAAAGRIPAATPS